MLDQTYIGYPRQIKRGDTEDSGAHLLPSTAPANGTDVVTFNPCEHGRDHHTLNGILLFLENTGNVSQQSAPVHPRRLYKSDSNGRRYAVHVHPQIPLRRKSKDRRNKM